MVEESWGRNHEEESWRRHLGSIWEGTGGHIWEASGRPGGILRPGTVLDELCAKTIVCFFLYLSARPGIPLQRDEARCHQVL